MKKILKTAVAAAVAFLTAAVVAVCASAETEDVELNTSLAKLTNGKWGQSATYLKDQFDCGRITPDSIVYVEFELDGEWTGSGAPIELVFQNYSTADPNIWAKIPPFEMTENSASFRYDEMLAAYGNEDFSTVDAMHIGDCGIPAKVTKVTVTNCKTVEIVTTTTTEATTTTAAETTAAETTAAETTAEASSDGEGGGIPIVPIVIATVVVAIIIVVVIIVLKSRKRFY